MATIHPPRPTRGPSKPIINEHLGICLSVTRDEAGLAEYRVGVSFVDARTYYRALEMMLWYKDGNYLLAEAALWKSLGDVERFED